jgi:dTDP-4-amino-4,6-dideoxygalactose transaminase
MKIPYLDLHAQYLSIKSEIDRAIQDVIDANAFVLGKSVQQFESDFAAYCGTRHCIGVNNGTNALLLALKVLDIGPGDEVITAANTFVATAAAIAHAGAKPVLVDVDKSTRNLDPALIEAAITDRTRAVMPVHLYGRPAPMGEITEVADNHGLIVIEDAAQAHGARYHSKRTGSLGRAAGFSFYPGKNLGAFGEGGAVTSDDDDMAAKARMLRDHGSSRKYHHDLLGYNARMEGIQGAVLGVKLKHLDAWTRRRQEIAARYNQLLGGLPVVTPQLDDSIEQVFHLYVIEVDDRDGLQQFLQERDVPTLIHYPVPIHLQPAFSFLGHAAGDFPVTEELCRRILSLPIFAEMTNDQVEYVAAQIRAWFDR